MQTGILIFEDNSILRDSIESIINFSPECLLLGSFGNAVHSDERVQQYNPDVVIMDIDMPGISGIEAVKNIRKINAVVQIIMLTVFEESETVLNAIYAGASGYLLKKHLVDRLVPSINEIMNGGAPMSPGVARQIIGNMQSGLKSRNTYDLTPREKEILSALSQGNSYKIISEKFFISIDTVRSHLKNIYKKLQVHSQTEAVAKALNEKIL